MKNRLANKLLWKKIFQNIASPTFRVPRKSKSSLAYTPFNGPSPEYGSGARLKFSIRVVAVLLLCSSGVWAEARAETFSINDAISQAVLTNPGVGEASANRRATETELRQAQSTLLPQVRLEARIGPERFDQQIVPPPLGNGQWQTGKTGSVVVRQLLFDGFASIHDIWRQAARVNAASFRVRERSELIALDAAEAYIDVVRFLRLVALASQNVANHEELFAHVKSRYSGGLAGEGDLQQALERVEASKATRADFQRSLDDARSKYRKIIGLEAINVIFPAPLRGLPRSKDDAIAVALRRNPTLLAAESDKEAAKQAFRVTDGAFVPSVSLEGRASHSVDADTFIGKRDDIAGKLVVSWDIFRGGQDSWRRAEMAERYTEETMRQARLQRDALESVDKAWAARTITVNRIAALTRQLAADKKTIAIYRKEYEIKQRKLIVPARVVVWNAGFPACVPSDSPRPREARSPASKTCVPAPPGAGMLTMPGAEPTTVEAGALKSCACATTPKSAPASVLPRPSASGISCVNRASGDAFPGRESMGTSRKLAPLEGSVAARTDSSSLIGTLCANCSPFSVRPALSSTLRLARGFPDKSKNGSAVTVD